MSEAGKLRKSHFRTWGSRQGEMGEEEGMSEKEQASKMCSFETLLFLISFSGFGEANCMFIRIHYLSVSDITPFLLFSHSSLSNIHINIKKYFSVVFPRFLFLSRSGHTNFYLCLRWASTFDYYSTTWFTVRMCSSHATNGVGILFVTLCMFNTSNIKQQQ